MATDVVVSGNLFFTGPGEDFLKSSSPGLLGTGVYFEDITTSMGLAKSLCVLYCSGYGGQWRWKEIVHFCSRSKKSVSESSGGSE